MAEAAPQAPDIPAPPFPPAQPDPAQQAQQPMQPEQQGQQLVHFNWSHFNQNFQESQKRIMKLINLEPMIG